MRVLVAYTTRHGSTRGVAERIGEAIRAGGSEIDIRLTSQVENLAGYDAVVFGSPVYSQIWPAEADEFLRRHAACLAERPMWLFSVGTFGDTKRLIGPLMRREPKPIQDYLASLHPLDYRVFAGVIDRDQWPLLSRLFFRALAGRLGDNRDWSAIDSWAQEIALALRSRA